MGMDKIKINEVAEVPIPLGGMARTLVNHPDLRLVILRVPAGEKVAEHIAPVEVVLLVLSGRGTIYAGSEAVAIAAGEIVTCPADLPRALAADNKDLELLVVRAPNP